MKNEGNVIVVYCFLQKVVSLSFALGSFSRISGSNICLDLTR